MDTPQTTRGINGTHILWIIAILAGGAYFLFATDLGKQLFSAGVKLTDEQRILGKWKQQDGSLTMEFFRNGTLREERMLNNGNGTYVLLPNRRIDLKIEGVLWGQNEMIARYDIEGDELVLTPDSGVGIAIRYRRAN